MKKNLENSHEWEALTRSPHIIAREFSVEDSLMEMEAHSHDFGILTCINKGIVKIATDTDSWIISQNTILYLPPQVLHTTEIFGGCSAVGAIIPSRLKKLLPSQVSILELSPLMHSILERMTSWELGQEYSPDQQRLARVAEDELKNAKQANYFHIPMPKDERLQKLARKILSSPEDMSSTEAWAKSSGMSLRSFSRHFADETGLAFTEWRQKVKVYTALKLLADNVSVGDVSFKLGYQNVSAFIAMFKAHIGSAPAEYMKKTNG